MEDKIEKEKVLQVLKNKLWAAESMIKHMRHLLGDNGKNIYHEWVGRQQQLKELIALFSEGL